MQGSQGSIWDSLLFLIYINDLTNLSDTNLTIMFADDISIFMPSKNIHEMEIAMNSEIKRLSVWLKINKLSLNIQKRHTMTFSNTNIIRERDTNIYLET